MAEEITFEQGFKELTEILDSLEQGEVAVAETVEKCRRAKALEQALRGFLEDRKGELERIEAGDELPEIRISAASAPRADAGPAANGRAPAADDELPF
jgi:exodeoxyribonuclease VII small subunit